jgi:hypothetical protein
VPDGRDRFCTLIEIYQQVKPSPPFVQDAIDFNLVISVNRPVGNGFANMAGNTSNQCRKILIVLKNVIAPQKTQAYRL